MKSDSQIQQDVIEQLNWVGISPSFRNADTEIAEAVLNALRWSATIDAGKVNVEVVDSHVTLTGKVRSLSEKEDAENATWLAPGISHVENRLVVQKEEFAY